VLPPRSPGKLAKGTKAKQHAMSFKVNSAITVIWRRGTGRRNEFRLPAKELMASPARIRVASGRG
jgi:hypothetical protein